MCPVVASGSLREMSLQALLKFEGPADYVNFFWVLSCPFIQVDSCTVLRPF